MVGNKGEGLDLKVGVRRRKTGGSGLGGGEGGFWRRACGRVSILQCHVYTDVQAV